MRLTKPERHALQRTNRAVFQRELAWYASEPFELWNKEAQRRIKELRKVLLRMDREDGR